MVQRRNHYLGDWLRKICTFDNLKWLLSLILGSGFLSVIWNKIVDIFISLEKYRWIITILIVLSFILITLLLYLRKSSRSAIVPLITPNYIIDEEFASFTYGKDESYFETNINLCIKKTGVNTYRGMFYWSGSEAPTFRCKSNIQHFIILTQRDVLTEYEVRLGKNYRKGDKVSITISAVMPDSQHHFIPYFSKRIVEPINKLRIKIAIPSQYNVSELIREEVAIVRNENDTGECVKLDEHFETIWEVARPKLYYVYSVRWEFPQLPIEKSIS